MGMNDLRNDAIDTRSIDIDWREALGEDCEGWTAFEALDCEECDREVVLTCSHNGEEHRYIEDTITVLDEDGDEEEVDNECMGTMYFEGPMMNYWYPLDLDDCEDAARKISHLPLCVVVFADGTTGLALTGGGMDLRWEICRAFMALGFYPPLNFCNLPRMAGYDKAPWYAEVIKACRKSCEIAMWWAESKDLDLARMEAEIDSATKEVTVEG